MRLLLLLSALLAALTGTTATRATALPVQASAATAVAARSAVTVAPAASRFAIPSYGALPPRRLALPPVPTVIVRILYAERRRE